MWTKATDAIVLQNLPLLLGLHCLNSKLEITCFGFPVDFLSQETGLLTNQIAFKKISNHKVLSERYEKKECNIN